MKRSEELNNLSPDTKRIELPELINICQAFERSGDSSQAIRTLRGWLSENPNNESSFAGWYELGRLLQGQKNYTKAEASFRAALEQRPLFFEARIALGKSLESQGKKKEAVETWLSSVPSDRLQIELLNNVARVQEDSLQLVKIEETLLRSLRLDSSQGDVLTTLLQVRQKLCRWPVISPDLPSSVEEQEKCIGPLMSLALFDDPEVSHEAARTFLESKGLLQRNNVGYKYSPHRSPKVRVGFLSADIRLHATSVFFAPLLKHFDREIFSVSLLDLTTTPEAFPEFREDLIQSVDQHIRLQDLNDEEAVERCRQLNLDILIDLGGLTAGARPGIVAQRVAAVQVGYIGFLSSTAISNLDYVITTEDLFPRRSEGFSEKPLFLNGPYLVMDSEPETAKIISKRQLEIPEDTFVFGALLNSYKINPDVFSAWMNILKSTKNTIIWLIEDNEVAKTNLKQRADEKGVDLERLIFSKRVHPVLYRNQLKLCDVFLDAFPYGSGATARDAIHANLPILTKPGNTMMSRLSSHMMSQLGVGDLVSKNIDDYVNKAVRLAKDRKLVSDLKARMASNKGRSDLYNQEKFVKDFYRVISNALKTYQLGT